MNLWRVTRRVLVHAEEIDDSSFGEVMRKDSEVRPKYFEMKHIFWVKVSYYLFIYCKQASKQASQELN